MRSIFAHIGMPKTGSKALQQLILSQHLQFEQAGIQPLRAFRTGLWHRNLFEGDPRIIAARIGEDLAPLEDILCSYEAGYIASDALIDALASAGRLRPLMILRDAVLWTNSFYNQMIKAHRVPWQDIRDFSVTHERVLKFLDIEGHVARWRQRCHTPNDMTVLRYDQSMDQVDILADWTGVTLTRQDRPNPNPAADLSSLRILIHLKRQMAAEPEEVLVRVVQQAHQMLKQHWIDTTQHRAPMLLSQKEQADLVARYEKPFNASLGNHSATQQTRFEFQTEPATVDKLDLFTCNTTELAVADEILEHVS